MPNQDKSPKIGLGNARVLCGMKDGERLALIAEGLPLLMESAQGFWQAAVALGGMPREREVLIGLAEEEAAKILILVDVVRCPDRLVGSRIGPMVLRPLGAPAIFGGAKLAADRPADVARLSRPGT